MLGEVEPGGGCPPAEPSSSVSQACLTSTDTMEAIHPSAGLLSHSHWVAEADVLHAW